MGNSTSDLSFCDHGCGFSIHFNRRWGFLFLLVSKQSERRYYLVRLVSAGQWRDDMVKLFPGKGAQLSILAGVLWV